MPEPQPSRFAVPLDELVATSRVELAEQVRVQPCPPPVPWQPEGVWVGDGRGDADGD